MKKFLFLTIPLLFASLSVKAQWQIGLQAGYDYDVYTINTGYQYDFNYVPQGGLTIAVPFQRQFTDWLGLRFDLAYVQKNTRMYRSSIYKEMFTNSKNSYISLPVMANFSFGGTYVRGFANVGGYIGYWTAGKVNGVQPNIDLITDVEDYVGFNEKYVFSKKRDNRLDAGLAGGIGLSVQTKGRIGFNIEGRVYYGLTSTKNNYMRVNYPAYHTTFAIQAGVFFLLDKVNLNRNCNCE